MLFLLDPTGTQFFSRRKRVPGKGRWLSLNWFLYTNWICTPKKTVLCLVLGTATGEEELIWSWRENLCLWSQSQNGRRQSQIDHLGACVGWWFLQKPILGGEETKCQATNDVGGREGNSEMRKSACPFCGFRTLDEYYRYVALCAVSHLPYFEAQQCVIKMNYSTGVRTRMRGAPWLSFETEVVTISVSSAWKSMLDLLRKCRLGLLLCKRSFYLLTDG